MEKRLVWAENNDVKARQRERKLALLKAEVVLMLHVCEMMTCIEVNSLHVSEMWDGDIEVNCWVCWMPAVVNFSEK